MRSTRLARVGLAALTRASSASMASAIRSTLVPIKSLLLLVWGSGCWRICGAVSLSLDCILLHLYYIYKAKLCICCTKLLLV